MEDQSIRAPTEPCAGRPFAKPCVSAESGNGSAPHGSRMGSATATGASLCFTVAVAVMVELGFLCRDTRRLMDEHGSGGPLQRCGRVHNRFAVTSQQAFSKAHRSRAGRIHASAILVVAKISSLVRILAGLAACSIGNERSHHASFSGSLSSPIDRGSSC